METKEALNIVINFAHESLDFISDQEIEELSFENSVKETEEALYILREVYNHLYSYG
jgi:hypothetical protein